MDKLNNIVLLIQHYLADYILIILLLGGGDIFTIRWGVDVHIQDLGGSGKYIGASAVQGRKIYGMKISKPQTVYVKRTEA